MDCPGRRCPACPAAQSNAEQPSPTEQSPADRDGVGPFVSAQPFRWCASGPADAPYQFTALGVIRVRDGEIVRYDDYMDPVAVARLLGRTDDLVAALTNA